MLGLPSENPTNLLSLAAKLPVPMWLWQGDHGLDLRVGRTISLLAKCIEVWPQGDQGIYTAMKNHKEVVYLLWGWRPIMFIVKSIPEPIFKKLSLG